MQNYKTFDKYRYICKKKREKGILSYFFFLLLQCIFNKSR